MCEYSGMLVLLGILAVFGLWVNAADCEHGGCPPETTTGESGVSKFAHCVPDRISFD